MFQENQAVIVGFSGGPDSVFLLLCLLEYKKKCNIKIILAHVNHNLRDVAEAEAAFCKALAVQHNLEYFEKSVDIAAGAKARKESVETYARSVRYDFFKQIGKNQQSYTIATGHHLNDNVETAVHRFIRGSSIYGLRGIEAKSAYKIRPLLDVKKSDILTYLNDNNHAYCVDASNFDTAYTRNVIRNQIIPNIEKSVPEFQEKIAVLQKELCEIHSDIIKFVPTPIEGDTVNIVKLKALSPYCAKFFINQFVSRWKIALTRSKTEQIYQSLFSGGTVRHRISERWLLEKSYECIAMKTDDQCENLCREAVKFVIGKRCTLNGVTIRSEIVSSKRSKGAIYLDYDQISEKNLDIRYRQPGDFMQVLKNGQKKKLKEIMINDKIPQSDRNQMLLICDKQEVIVMSQRRISHQYGISETTRKMVEIEISGGNSGRKEAP